MQMRSSVVSWPVVWRAVMRPSVSTQLNLLRVHPPASVSTRCCSALCAGVTGRCNSDLQALAQHNTCVVPHWTLCRLVCTVLSVCRALLQLYLTTACHPELVGSSTAAVVSLRAFSPLVGCWDQRLPAVAGTRDLCKNVFIACKWCFGAWGGQGWPAGTPQNRTACQCPVTLIGRFCRLKTILQLSRSKDMTTPSS